MRRTPGAPPVAPAVEVPQIIPVGGRTMVSRDQGATNLSNGTDTQMHTRAKHRALVSSAGVTLMFANTYNFGGAPTANPDAITVRCAVEAGGFFYPVWFDGGKRDATIDPGGIVVGRCGAPIVAGATFFSRTKVSVASSGLKWPVGLGDSMNGTDEGAVGTTASTDLTTSGTITANSNSGYFPYAIHGTAPVTQSVAVLTDSVGAGKGDNLVAGKGAGWIVRAIPDGTPYNRLFPVSGMTLGQWTATANVNNLGIILSSARHDRALVTLGINDVTGGQTLANIQARMQTVWAMLAAHGATVFQATITPVTTSSDSWATVNNQTVTATNGIRTALNDWLRAGPVGLAGVIEIADLAESARNSGKWNAGYTSDGTHPNVTGHAALSAVSLAELLA